MTAAPNRHEEVVLSGEIHRADDVGGSRTAGDYGGILLNHPVPNYPGIIVARILGKYYLTVESLHQILNDIR
ncbi:hypothetical protein C500_14910 [Natrialba magadii ATCC 43099]|uniref:Uncharacterized protein n=1 Tax=Natrialba magadii (strain ATCC 43099 / DSM 3394 / CCM 3739 / CIP 104546 / IAM 13178 / JCM 8861 / NBRC 102185 / NCIMB 2190 / MS3) TaxID=547559 RepID=L9USJ5_NATMM|nr:hypothetical protein C500_14910 [Natrialba magadii ATCC 43099]